MAFPRSSSQGSGDSDSYWEAANGGCLPARRSALSFTGDPVADAEERRSECRNVCRSPIRTIEVSARRSLSHCSGDSGDSDPYWSQTDWDPEERVYVGAGAGSGRYGFTAIGSAATPQFGADSIALRGRTATAFCSTAAATSASSSGGRYGFAAVVQSSKEEMKAVGESDAYGFGHQCSGAVCPKERASSFDGAARVGAPNRVACPVIADDEDYYWNADGWDPDQRIYVGASEGFGHHLTATKEPCPMTALPAQTIR